MAFVPVVPPALRNAAELKIEELDNVKASFESRYAGTLNAESIERNVLGRLTHLLESVKDHDPHLWEDEELSTFSRYVEQAQNDRSISQAKLLRLEQNIRDKLEKHANRLEVSSLHVDLLKEALDAEDPVAFVAAKVEKATLDEEFEMVEGELESVLEVFEKNAFSTKEVDVKAIEDYLASLFDSPAARVRLSRLREDIEGWSDDIVKEHTQLEEEVLEWCIVDLLKNGLLSDEKKQVLQGFLHTPGAMSELLSTINMKSVRHWKYRNAEKGLPVTARHNADGKYCITAEEDVIDMLFLHCVAVAWSMKLKEILKETLSFKSVWSGNNLLSNDELDLREYYLLGPRPPPKTKSCSTCHPPPPPRDLIEVDDLPPPRRRYPVPPPPPGFRSRKMKKSRSYGCPPPPPLPLPGTPNLNDIRYTDYIREFFLHRLPKQNGATPECRDASVMQAKLMKALASEAKLREALDGSAYSLATNFTSFASSLPHQTIITVLKFIGAPQQWIDLFIRFLAVPLNMGPIVRGTSDQILPRTCGIPVAHGLETFFGEALLFFLDLAVHQKTNGYLYRLRDECHFVGKAQQRDDALEEIYNFADVMGLSVRRMDDSGSTSIGFVHFTTGEGKDGRVHHSIDSAKVEAHAHRVKKQLASSSTVLEWIRIWNSTVGEYETHLFGPLAHVFGKTHLNAVTQAHNRMHEIIFPGSNLTDHVKNLLSTHLNRTLTDPPFALEALIYLPLAYGGLGVKNPYTTINLAHTVFENPSSRLDSFLEDEKKYYARAFDQFTRLTPTMKKEKLTSIFKDDEKHISDVFSPDNDPDTFPSYKSLTADRERAAYPCLPPLPYPTPMPFTTTPQLIPAYQRLFEEPVDEVRLCVKIDDEVSRLSGMGDMKRWSQIIGEELWVLQMYGEECFERYGGLEIWCRESVPRELLKAVRGEGLDGDDDDSVSVSTYSEV